MRLNSLVCRRRSASRSRCEGALRHLGGGRRSLAGRSLELEYRRWLAELGFRDRDASARSVWASSLINVAEGTVGSGRVARRHGVSAEGRRLGSGAGKHGRLGAESGSVGSGLETELSEVEIGAGTVTHVHGLVELALAVVAVEDDAVQGDADDLDDDLDDDADQAPVLEAADESVVDLLGEHLGTGVVDARPSPHVLVASVDLGVLEHTGGNHPHDAAEDEPADGKHGVVSADLLGTLVATTAVGDEDNNAGKERDTGHRKNQLLRPSVCSRGP